MEEIPGQLSSVGVPVEGHSISPVTLRLYGGSWRGFFTLPQGGYMPGLMRLEDHIKKVEKSASLSAGGSTDLAA